MIATPQRKRRKSGAKIATKREISGLMDHIGQLIEDPSRLVPETDGGMPSAVSRLERRFKRIARSHARPRLLRWRMRFGPRLTRAFANLVLVQHSGRASRMGSFRSPVGDLKYAVRGNVSARHVAAIQHFRYPEVRILGYRELAQETRGVIWATEDGVAWRPRNAPPPEGWFDLVQARLPIEMRPTGSTLNCPHLAEASDPLSPQAPHGLEIAFGVGDLRIHVCERCIRDHVAGTERGVLATLAMFVIGLRAGKDIEVRPTGTPTDCVHDGACSWSEHRPTLGARTQEQYIAGTMNEAAVLDKLRPRWEEAVRNVPVALYVAGDICYGNDREALLDALHASPAMRDAVRRVLERGPPVIIAGESSVNKVLAAAGDAFQAELRATHPDPAALEGLLERHRRSPPVVLLEEVLAASRARAALSGYPRYAALTGGAATADRLARAYKVDGMPGLVASADKELKQRAHKPTVWAALRLAAATSGREWQFQKNDLEAGEFLEPPLRTLLDAAPADYHAALAAIHTMSGGAGALPKPVGTV